MSVDAASLLTLYMQFIPVLAVSKCTTQYYEAVSDCFALMICLFVVLSHQVQAPDCYVQLLFTSPTRTAL